jgi:hypothetical protein
VFQFKHVKLTLYSRSSVLDLSQVKGTRTDFKLQNVDATFNDTTGEYYKAFEARLASLDGKTSEKDLCIEEYLVESEKAWFKKYRAAKLGRNRDSSPMPIRRASPRPSSDLSRPSSSASHGIAPSSDGDSIGDAASLADEFLLGEHYERPSMLKRWLQTRIGDWPIYSLLLALGQIMAANSYQITLLSGDQGQTPEKLYIIGGIFMATSCLWWFMFRSLKSIYVLSLPFAFYGLAFFFLGMAPFLSAGGSRDWMRNVATGLYTTASSSGSLYFAMNFGDEGKLISSSSLLFSLLTAINRWISNQILGPSCLHHSGNTANLHHSTFLLGNLHDYCYSDGPSAKESHHRISKNGSCNASNCRPHVRHRNHSLHLLTTILPAIARQDTKFLSNPSPPETNPMVLRHRHPPKLLLVQSLRPQLGLPLVFKTRPNIRYHPFSPLLLRLHLGRLPCHLRQTIQIPFLGPSHLRNRSRRT